MNPFSFLRSLIATLLYPLEIAFFALIIVLVGLIPKARRLQDFFVGLWAQVSLKMFGVKVIVHGIDNLPQGGYVALFNHTSNFDILSVQSVVPQVRFGAKIELFKIPIFGHAMKAAGALPIERTNRSKVMRVYERAKQRLMNGESFILSPEGTRQQVEKLGPFKSGPFFFAISAQVPIVPIGIKGASKIQPKGNWLPNSHQWCSKIEVHIGKPIPTVGLQTDDKNKLQNVAQKGFNDLGLF